MQVILDFTTLSAATASMEAMKDALRNQDNRSEVIRAATVLAKQASPPVSFIFNDDAKQAYKAATGVASGVEA